jgi:hypothetical protein
MFEITTYPSIDFAEDLRAELSGDDFACVAPAFGKPTPQPPCEHPWVQLSYREIDMAVLRQAFSYAGIANTNSPLGLDAEFTPISRDQESVLFPISGLEKHLEATYPERIAALRSAGEPQRFLEAKYEYDDVTEFLLAGLLACIAYSRSYGHAIVFRW